jgi:hypothetical protein
METIYLIIGLILLLWAALMLHMASEKLGAANKARHEAQEALAKLIQEKLGSQAQQNAEWPNPPEISIYNSKGQII